MSDVCGTMTPEKTALHDALCEARRRKQDMRDPVAKYFAGLNPRKIERPLRVQALAGDQGTAHWRVNLPILELGLDPGFEVRISSSLTPDDVKWFDIVYLNRCLVDPMVLTHWGPDRNISPPITEQFRAAGKLVVFDIDDWLDDVPKYNVGHVGIQKERQPEIARELIRRADAVTYSTEYLAKLYAKSTGRTQYAVLPNLVDLDMWPEPAERTHPEVRLAWAGSTTHWGDLNLVEVPILETMRRHPSVHFYRLGCWADDTNAKPVGEGFQEHNPLGALPRGRVYQYHWEIYTHYLYRYLQQLDIGICPLVPNDFSRAKSNIKFLEYVLSGMACAAANVEAYNVDPGPTVLVKPTDVIAWREALCALVSDRRGCREMGMASREYAMERYDVHKRIGEWINVFAGVAGRKDLLR